MLLSIAMGQSATTSCRRWFLLVFVIRKEGAFGLVSYISSIGVVGCTYRVGVTIGKGSLLVSTWCRFYSCGLSREVACN